MRVGLVTGQAPADFADRPENLAHAFGARLCRVRDLAPGVLVLELVRADTLADPIPALPIAGVVDLAGLPVGRCEDGSQWRLRLAATHVLIAEATGSGKGSVIWSLIRALLPAIAAGWAQVWALDPKRMELSFGRALFHRYACQADAMVELLEAAVAEMHDRAEQFGGRTRTFTPSAGFPFLVILVDELAFLKVWTVTQLQTFLQRARSGRFFALWILEATSGMRRCELAGARRDLLDLDAGTLAIETTRVVVDGRVIESDGKTENAQHVLALDPFTLAALKVHVDELDQERRELGPDYHDHGVLFCWEDGRPPHPDTITRRFKQLAAAAGLQEIDLHDVRHSYATAGRDAKIDWKALSQRIGHADVAFTMKQYVQTDLEADRQVANTLAELIIGGP